MSARIIDGSAIGLKIREEVTARIAKAGITPGFVDILIGDDPASKMYVGMKYRAAAACGMEAFDHLLPVTTSLDDAMKIIDDLNADPKVHGLMVQGPLPAGSPIDIFDLQKAISPEKDVDGLHPENQGLLAMGRPRYVGATPAGVVELLRRSEVPMDGAIAVIVGRSTLVTRPLAILLSQKDTNCTVTVCHTGTVDLRAETRRADILIVATGRGRRITSEMVKPGAAVVDVGTRSGPDGTLIGDVDFDDVAPIAGWITPVPGGVGPLTVAMLLDNVARAAGC